jgi:alpha-tubulin suppressor-like RCC1 family protein
MPVPVETDLRFKSISAGAHHTCAIAADDRVYCWGYNRYGQGGINITVDIILPSLPAGDFRAVAVSAGRFQTCAVSIGGAMYCWGANDYAQLGIGSDVVIQPTPTPVQTSLAFLNVDAGATHTCGLVANDVYCWGSSGYGELGDATQFKPGLAGRSSPTKTISLPAIAQISAGEFQTCAASESGELFCWGRALYGQTGLSPADNVLIPQIVRVDGETLKFSVVATGGRTHMCAIAGGAVYCWGTGALGQLGIGGQILSATPHRVTD